MHCSLFTRLFQDISIFIHTAAPLWLQAGSARSFLTPDVCDGICLHVCLFLYDCARASAPHSPPCPPHPFRSILFKDQTRGWWLIFFFSPSTFFHLLRKERNGSAVNMDEGSAFHRGARNNRCIPSLHPEPPTSSSLGGLLPTLRRRENDSSPWTCGL